MGWGGAVDKVLSWFTPERAAARRRSKIRAIEREINELLKKEWSEKDATRIQSLRNKLRVLKEATVNGK